MLNKLSKPDIKGEKKDEPKKEETSTAPKGSIGDIEAYTIKKIAGIWYTIKVEVKDGKCFLEKDTEHLGKIYAIEHFQKKLREYLFRT